MWGRMVKKAGEVCQKCIEKGKEGGSRDCDQ